jgi:hypothetical protein
MHGSSANFHISSKEMWVHLADISSGQIGPSEVRASSGANLVKPLVKVFFFLSFGPYFFPQKGLSEGS